MKSLLIKGIIGWDFTSQDLINFLDENKDLDELNIVFDSPGGSVFEGFAIYNLLKQFKGNISCEIVFAASISAYLTTACNKITVHENSTFLIHNAWLVAVGDAEKLRKSADTVEKISTVIASAFASQSGKELQEIKSLMDEEVFLFGNEILDFGFASEFVSTNPEFLPVVDEAKKIIADANVLLKDNLDPVDDLVDTIQNFFATPEINSVTPEKISNTPEKISDTPEIISEKISDDALFDLFDSMKQEIISSLKNDLQFLNLNADYIKQFVMLHFSEDYPNMIPASKLALSDFLDFLFSKENKNLPVNNFSTTFFEKLKNFVDNFFVSDLTSEQAVKPTANQINPEIFPFAKVDPASRELHIQALNLMKESNLTYLQSIKKLLS